MGFGLRGRDKASPSEGPIAIVERFHYKPLSATVCQTIALDGRRGTATVKDDL